jgi:hypothetical protein
VNALFSELFQELNDVGSLKNKPGVTDTRVSIELARDQVKLQAHPLVPTWWHRHWITQGWMQARAAHRDPVAVANNQKTFATFKSYLDAGYPGVVAHEIYPEAFLDQRPHAHPNELHEAVPLEDLVDNLLRKIQTSDDDDEFERAGAILALRRLIEGGQQFADVFLMGSCKPQIRSLTALDRINQVHQGHSKNYGGDKAFIHQERVTFHFRKFDLMDEKKNVVASEVPWYSIHIPSGLAKRYILQNEK